MPQAAKPQSLIGPAERGFVLEDYVLYNLVRTASTYNEEMSSALKRFGLDTLKWRVLMLLEDRSPSTVSEIAMRSVTKMPTLTRVLIRMEEEGLVIRKAMKGDKRVVQVTMTPKALSTLRVVQKIGQKVFESAIEGVNADEGEALTRVLRRMRTNLSRSRYGVDASEGVPVKARAR